MLDNNSAVTQKHSVYSFKMPKFSHTASLLEKHPVVKHRTFHTFWVILAYKGQNKALEVLDQNWSILILKCIDSWDIGHTRTADIQWKTTYLMTSSIISAVKYRLQTNVTPGHRYYSMCEYIWARTFIFL